MKINGSSYVGIYWFIKLNTLKDEVEGFNFLKNGGVAYVNLNDVAVDFSLV
jgi:hypothetical protein